MNKLSEFVTMDKISSFISPLTCKGLSTIGGHPSICSILEMAPPILDPHLQQISVCNSTVSNCSVSESKWFWQTENQQQEQITLANSSFNGNGNFSLTPVSDFLTTNLELTVLTGVLSCYLFFGTLLWLFSRVIPLPPLKFLCEFVLSHLTFLIILPFFLVLLVANSILRFFVSLTFRLYYKRQYSILAGSDGFWAHNDVFANTTNFYALYVLEGKCDIEKIRKKIQTKVIEKRSPYNGKLMYSRLKHKIVKKLGYYCCEKIPESDFHISNHIKFILTDKDCDGNENSTLKVDPAKISLTESQVFAQIGTMCNLPLDDSKPQWEILVIPQYTYDKDVIVGSESCETNNMSNGANVVAQSGEDIAFQKKSYYALIYRIHHSYMDGISAGYTLQTAMADSPPRLAIDPMKKLNIPFYKHLFMYILLVVIGPVNLLKAMLESDSNSFHGPNLTGPKTVGWSRPVDMKALKEIKTVSKTTTTAILLSCLGSSIRSLALTKKLPVPDKINAFITIAMLPYPNSHPQNRFTLSVLPIRIGLQTCLDRLKAAYKSLCDMNCSPDVILSFYFIRIVGLLPAVLINIFAELVHTTMLFSNVPGPAETTFMFDGDRLVDATCWSPIKGRIGIGMSLFSYAGRVRASMVADHVALPDPSELTHLIKAFETEILELGTSTGVKNYDDIFHKMN